MFDYTSRYANQKKLQYERRDGRIVSYAARRILPARESFDTLVDVYLGEGQRLDNIAALTLGDPQLFWQICDANGVLNPFDLMSGVGKMIKVPMPGRQMP
ncbi:hypothetical protein E0H93_34850 [Rhizobium leguminosarum bv. viciae]|uniref:hypothetical protein n=1 Tax=Rhizobium leguminosarum TaxID=384 RepID=UPI001040B722|nr:hypothetical protein [Rhizobium leguminosarum]MBY5530191.1 hypothetical protein [Rhizobium leguminosarum]TBY30663.1 hypothetical protein E0H55_20490 [Rhizobium leguminosarum bv. viciae]TBY35727.1 hypothetical protein E0H60_22895 [Rhizobium leguminosarum bv. viciae]TCA94817.1 hypothetical protein E0H93_34850 [Rhizobium leguminosarum bv. viciae]